MRLDHIGGDGQRPVEVGQGILVAAELAEHDAPFVEGLRRTGIQRHRAIATGERLVQPVQLAQDVALVGEDRDRIRIDR